MYCDVSGIKYIHGCEVYLTHQLLQKQLNERTGEVEDIKVRDNYHTVLLAKNMDGVKELNTLISNSTKDDHFYYKPRITFEEFFNISDNIIKISACLASPLNRLIKTYEVARKENDQEKMRILADDIDKLFKHYDYYEIQHHNNEEQAQYNKLLYFYSQKYNKPLIAGTDTHSINQYKAECRNLLQIAKGIEFDNESELDLTYKTYDELIKAYEEQNALPMEVVRQALQNTIEMADSTDDLIIDTSFKYPKMYENDDEAYVKRIYSMFQDKLDKGIIPLDQKEQFEKDIEEEIRVFRKIDMMGFMLSMAEIISWCKENGIPVGFARGSVGGSRVAYVTDIIDLNPVQWKTVFSRFCNEDRKELGDIDVDVYADDRQKVYDHIISRFGKAKTAYVLAMGTVAEKGTIDEIGRALSYLWNNEHPHEENPYSLEKIKEVKAKYEVDPTGCREEYPKIFYYFDGMVGTIISQSMHPAGIVVSPITLPDNYGVFENDNHTILQLDMECVHETGLVKYDLLGLKNVGIVKKTYEYLGKPYPRSYEIDWNDQKVWEDIKKSNIGIFQFESSFAHQMLRKFDAKSIEDMSLVTAMIRPSGESYRNALAQHIINKNPSDMIDDLLKDNLGYLVYQEDVIKFLVQICGFSGSDADNTRRAIGRKDYARLQKALPQILEGYCEKSDKPREVAEEEAKIFLKVIEDASSYMFGYNHSIAYCLLGYVCAYLRYYHPYEFLTAFLNCSESEEDIANGTALAQSLNIKIVEPKFRHAKSDYMFDKETKCIYKGMRSIKFMNAGCADELYSLRDNKYDTFIDLLVDLKQLPSMNSKKLDILIKLDFFSEFGNSFTLTKINEYFTFFKNGTSKNMSKEKLTDEIIKNIVERHSNNTEKQYTKLDTMSILHEIEEYTRCLNLNDYPFKLKLQSQIDYLGYINVNTHSTDIEERKKLVVLDVKKMVSRKGRNAGKPWCVVITTQSIGSGKQGSWTISYKTFEHLPIDKLDIIKALTYNKNGDYWWLTAYKKLDC